MSTPLSSMAMYLGPSTLPKFGHLKELVSPNTREMVTLDGGLHIDFMNQKRVWELSWDIINYTDYTTIRNLYNNQFRLTSLYLFTFPSFNINAVPVYITLNDNEIIWNGSIANNVVMTIKEEFAIS